MWSMSIRQSLKSIYRHYPLTELPEGMIFSFSLKMNVNLDHDSINQPHDAKSISC
jgi:hypothetical protein